MAWPSSCSIVSIQYWIGTTFASTRMSPGAVDVDAERVLALAVAREEVAALQDRSVSSPSPSYVRRESSTRSALSR